MKVLLVVYDNGSHINWFPHGLAYVSSYIRHAGHEVEIYQQDITHASDSEITTIINKNKYDVVGLGFIAGYYQYKKAKGICKAVRAANYRPLLMLGGHGPSPEPEYFLDLLDADVIIRGEGEETTGEILRAVEQGSGFSAIKGITYKENNEVINTEERPVIQDVNSILFPSWDLFNIDFYSLIKRPGLDNSDRMLPVLSGRGCPYKCNFCFRMPKGFRPRSAESIIEEIQFLKKNYHITAIDFSDELLMCSVKRTTELCNAFLEADLSIKWSCNGRLNFARKDVLEIMKKSGCTFINYGVECLDDDILKIMNKNLTVEKIIKGVESTSSVGIYQGLNVIFGNINENKRTLREGVKFLKKYGDAGQMRTIRPVTPYPGSPLYYYALEKGLLKDVKEFYEEKHLNSDLLAVNFTELSDKEFYEALEEANVELIEDYYEKSKQKSIENARNLYHDKNLAFRGFRQL